MNQKIDLLLLLEPTSIYIKTWWNPFEKKKFLVVQRPKLQG
jgi:hypothetical protein